MIRAEYLRKDLKFLTRSCEILFIFYDLYKGKKILEKTVKILVGFLINSCKLLDFLLKLFRKILTEFSLTVFFYSYKIIMIN